MFRFLLLLAPAFLLAQSSMPEQAARGEKVFFDESKGPSCGNCHALAGRGTAVGPNLTNIARIPPRAIATAIRATRTQYVQAVKLKSGETFPGMPGKKDEKTAEYYDLSKTPPAARKLELTEIDSTQDNATWKHPPSSTNLDKPELADVIAFIRWAAYKDKGGVTQEEVQ